MWARVLLEEADALVDVLRVPVDCTFFTCYRWNTANGLAYVCAYEHI